MRRHAAIGERIVACAASRALVSDARRSSGAELDGYDAAF